MMKDSYFRYDPEASALSTVTIMPIVIQSGETLPIAMVTSVQSNGAARGKGWIKELLKEMCEDADRLGVLLLLSVSPDWDTDGNRLIELYKSYGFVLDPKEVASFACMRRYPKRT